MMIATHANSVAKASTERERNDRPHRPYPRRTRRREYAPALEDRAARVTWRTLSGVVAGHVILLEMVRAIAVSFGARFAHGSPKWG
jgi:hypothetical protein